MTWRSLLKGDPVPWLLERRDAAVRALTLRSLLDRGPRDGELREAQQRAMSTPPISTILQRQRPDGGWQGNLYGPKYEGTHWANLLLVEYGVDPSDPRVRRAARYVLEQLGTPEMGGMRWVFNKDHGAAHRIMMHVHQHGIGECGIYTYEVAETKVTQVMDFARKHQHPLQCVMEKK